MNGLYIKVYADAPGPEEECGPVESWRRADVVLNGNTVATGWAKKMVSVGADGTQADLIRSVEGEAVARAKQMLGNLIEVRHEV